MSLKLDKSTWKRVRLGDVIVRSRKQVDPMAGSVDRYVAGGHFDSGSPTLERWGDVNDGQMGSTFRYVFQPEQVLFLSARPYLRKVGIAQFEGVVADKTYVLDALPTNGLSQEFLPFVLLSEPFYEFAVAEATGSMNPRLLWGATQRFEFDLPPLDEQRRIADLLWAVERQRRSIASVKEAAATVRRVWLDRAVNSLLTASAIDFKRVWCSSPESGYSTAPADEDTGRYVLSLAALGPDGYRVGHLKNAPDAAEVRSAALSQGDVLISRANTVDAVGRAGIFSEDRNDVSFPDTMMRLRLVPEALPEFAVAVLTSSHGRAHMRRTAAGSATSMVKINRASLGRFAFPLTDIKQQASVLDRLAVFDAALAAAEMQVSALIDTKRALSTAIFGGTV